MKKALFLLVVFMFFAVGCVEVVMPASNAYSESNSESSPNVSPIIVNVPAQQSGSQPQSNQFQAPQTQYSQPVVAGNNKPATTYDLQPTPDTAHGRNGYVGQSSPVYLDLCVSSYNTTGKFKWDNCLAELKKSGREGELKGPLPVDNGEIEVSNDPVEAKSDKTP